MKHDAMNKLSYGLFVVTAKDGDKDNGCIINTAMQVTSEPNCIIIAVNKNNYTHDMIARTGKFNLSVLTENSSFETFRHFGFQSGEDTDKMKEIEYARSNNGLVYLIKETNAYISAEVVTMYDLGTHTMFLARVTQSGVISDEESVTYSYYHKNIKPAPAAAETSKGYVCTVCGYIFQGDVLPEDFICPLCKHPASDFKPL